ncbi:MAG: molybdopterin-guanine dinucleotide biosynthesis protein B [Burkholderiaceae bacterium]
MNKPGVFGFAGYSGSGKTTLIEQLIPRFVEMGKTVSLIKHAHHTFDIDQPGKDSWRHREAGASEVLISSGGRWVLMHELRGQPEPTLEDQLKALNPCDLVLIEGYKRASIPKLEVHRQSIGKPLLWPEDDNIVGIAADSRLQTGLPQLDINNPIEVATFILKYLDSNHE